MGENPETCNLLSHSNLLLVPVLRKGSVGRDGHGRISALFREGLLEVHPLLVGCIC